MMQHPIQIGNILLILLGIVGIVVGPVVVYRTIRAVQEIRKNQPGETVHPWSNGFNILIGIALFIAGICFVVNNLRGNPLV